MLLARLLSLLPFTVNVSGRKHDLILKVGRILNPNPKGIKLCGTWIKTKDHPQAQIIAFAGHNFLRDFKRSHLGHYMKSTLKKDGLFVDVGANLGGYSMYGKELGLRTICVEASPHLSKFLGENEEAFGEVHPVAVSDKNGVATFFLSESNIGGSSLTMSSKGWEGSGYSGEAQVETKRLDDILEGKIDLMKIDVEGHEEAAVLGASNMVKEGRIERIWCEVRGAKSDRNPNSYLPICKFLTENGYDVYTYDGSLKDFEWEQATDLPQYFDLLFIRV